MPNKISKLNMWNTDLLILPYHHHHHKLATSHSFSSWNGQNIFPLQDVPTCHFPAWKIIPASFYTNADSLFRSQLKSYFCKKVFPGHSLHNLKFGRLLIISHNWCYLASYPIPICDYPCCVTVFHFWSRPSHRLWTPKEQGQVDFAGHTTSIHIHIRMKEKYLQSP